MIDLLTFRSKKCKKLPRTVPKIVAQLRPNGQYSRVIKSIIIMTESHRDRTEKVFSKSHILVMIIITTVPVHIFALFPGININILLIHETILSNTTLFNTKVSNRMLFLQNYAMQNHRVPNQINGSYMIRFNINTAQYNAIGMNSLETKLYMAATDCV